MKTLELILFLVLLLNFAGCDIRNSVLVNKQYSTNSQPERSVNTTTKTVNENVFNTENSAESNKVRLDSQVSATRDEITSSAEKTVQAFYQALEKRNRKLALKYAKPEVVRQLLKDKESRLDWRFIECSEPKVKEYGDVACIYFFEGGGIGIFLRKDSNEQYQIVSTYYIASD